jgi:hypothetical protein
MENQDHSPDNSTKKSGPIRQFIHILIPYIINLVCDPLRSGLAYFVGGLAAALVIGWVLFPMVLYSKDEQPVNFSHAIHTDPDIVDVIEGDTEAEKCSFCHSFRDDGSFTGIPNLATCMECHDDPESPLGETDEEKKFLEEFVANLKEIPWYQYSEQPDCVYFSHIPHVKNGELACRTCHGDHSKTDILPLYEKNRISGYSINIWGKNISGYKTNTWDRMKMDDCAECHTKNNHEENNDCFVCHK